MTAPHEQVGDVLPRLYTIKHAAERWDLSQKTLRRMIEAGELGAYQLERPRNGRRGSRMLLDETELLALLSKMRV